MRNDTSFIGRTQPLGVGNSTVNPRISNRCHHDDDTHETKFMKLSLDKQMRESYTLLRWQE
jgi:hypothetical protein